MEKSALIGINERKKPVMSDFLHFQNTKTVILKIPRIGHYEKLFLVNSNQNMQIGALLSVFSNFVCVNSPLLILIVLSAFPRFQNSEF